MIDKNDRPETAKVGGEWYPKEGNQIYYGFEWREFKKDEDGSIFFWFRGSKRYISEFSELPY